MPLPIWSLKPSWIAIKSEAILSESELAAKELNNEIEHGHLEANLNSLQKLVARDISHDSMSQVKVDVGNHLDASHLPLRVQLNATVVDLHGLEEMRCCIKMMREGMS